MWKLKVEDKLDHLPKNVKVGLSTAVCGEDMEGDWNTLKTCLLKNAEVVCGVTKGPSKRKIP